MRCDAGCFMKHHGPRLCGLQPPGLQRREGELQPRCWLGTVSVYPLADADDGPTQGDESSFGGGCRPRDERSFRFNSLARQGFTFDGRRRLFRSHRSPPTPSPPGHQRGCAQTIVPPIRDHHMHTWMESFFLGTLASTQRPASTAQLLLGGMAPCGPTGAGQQHRPDSKSIHHGTHGDLTDRPAWQLLTAGAIECRDRLEQAALVRQTSPGTPPYHHHTTTREASSATPQLVQLSAQLRSASPALVFQKEKKSLDLPSKVKITMRNGPTTLQANNQQAPAPVPPPLTARLWGKEREK